ncbi:MAG: NAD-dependent epimerase/dehydratase family protein [Chitinophagales bacterium]|jgi:nucleoside-diphosphate-sugar epimerase|nr:NAD-dependent epimerase/dehydratase family protein [Chitinophagales bacterium]
MHTKILIIGAGGQIGLALTRKLKAIYESKNVLATDLRADEENEILPLDVLDSQALYTFVKTYQITEIYHLAAILSASGELNPQKAWKINIDGLFNVLEVSRELKVSKVFFPSTIAVFGDHIDQSNCANYVPLLPKTVYGISKVAGELWAAYYFDKFGLDIRSLRYPGVIGYQSLPGGGTTDYAVDIFLADFAQKPFECFLAADRALPMIFMDDAIDATISLMQADKAKLTVRTSYNIHAMSFTPSEIAAEIQRHNPKFDIIYKPDFRDEIAKTWPAIIDDSLARQDWQWKPKYDLSKLVQVMRDNIHQLASKQQ